MPDSSLHQQRRAMAVRLFFATGAALAVSTLLPWISIDGGSSLFGVTVNTGLPSNGQTYLFVFAAVYAGAGYTLSQHRRLRWLVATMWLVNAWMVVNVYGLYHGLHDQGDGGQTAGISINPGVGMLIATLAVAIGVLASVTLQRARISAAIAGRKNGATPASEPASVAVAPPAPGAQLSPDGLWWWNGTRWCEVPTAVTQAAHG